MTGAFGLGLLDALDGASAAADNSPVIVALIGLAGILFSALISGYFGTRGERLDKARRRGDEPALPPASTRSDDVAAVRELLDELDDARKVRDAAEREAAYADRQIEALHERVDVLERALIVRGLAPWLIVTGQESDTDARLPNTHRPRPRL